jgi:phosphoacetylglucosamine mutase
MFCIGILAVLRSKSHSGKYVGVMVTASHNPACDNGVKLVEPLGEMLSQEWEPWAIELANAVNFLELNAVVDNLINTFKIDMSCSANVLIGRDTRPSGSTLVLACQDGVNALSGNIMDCGVVTTPLLHYLTRCNNDDSFGKPSNEGYYLKLSRSFEDIVGGKKPFPSLTVDCANGVGALALKDLVGFIKPQHLNISFSHCNTTKPEVLNFESGADYVKLKQVAPKGMNLKKNEIACSIDGDADRIVFYYVDGNNLFNKIPQLFACWYV